MRPNQSIYRERGTSLTVVVSGLSSDAHTWNLVYLQLILEELGHKVINLGGCVPEQELAARCREAGPDLIVLGSVNGHGFQDGTRAITALRECPGLITTPTVIGGKLDTVGGDPTLTSRLLDAGFDAVFPEADAGTMSAFRAFVTLIATTAASTTVNTVAGRTAGARCP